MKYFWMKDWAAKEFIKNSSPYSATMLMECLESKDGSRSLETATYPAKSLHAPNDQL
jgi:hypothetical protein